MQAKKSSMTTDLTSGNVVKQLVMFALPLFLSNALQAVYNLVDMIVVGNYVGAAGMSAVSTGGETLHLLTFLAMGFSSAGQVLIAQDVGAGRMDSVRKTIGTLFTLLMSASVVMTVVCYVIRGNILSWLNTPADAYGYTMDYTVICILGLFFIYGYNAVSAILRGMGDSKRPFVFIGVAAILNIILDIWFVKYLGMAAYGAALATVIGQGVSFVASIIYLYIKRDKFGFDFKPASFVPQNETVKKLLALGIPMAIQSAAVSFSKIVLTAWINSFDVIYSALGGVYNKVNMMAGIVSNSFTTAGSTMVGQNLGAKKYDRVPKVLSTVLWIGTAIFTVCSAALFLFSDAIFGLFTSDAAVLAAAGVLVLPTIINFYGSDTRAMAFSIINGSGNTKLNLCVALIDGLISRMGIAALLGYALHMDCLGFWLGDAIAGFVPMAIGCIYYFRGNWRKI